MNFFTTTIIALLISTVAQAAPSVSVQLSERDDRHSCGERFRGVINPVGDKGALKLQINTTELVGKITFKVMYTNNGYKNLMIEKYTSIETKKSEIKIPYFEIKDNSAFAVNQVFVTATDSSNTSVATSFSYRIYRSLVLEKSTESTSDCFTMFKSEKITGVYANTTSSPRRIVVEDRLTNSNSLYKARNTGWSFGLSAFSLAHIGVNQSYIKNKGKGLDVSTSVSVETSIAPGEAIVLNRQMTLYKDFYNVKAVGECGELEDAGVATYSHWTVSYPVAVLDMTLDNPFDGFSVGYDDQMNTCVEEDDNTDVYIPDSPSDENARITVDLTQDNTEFNQLGQMMNNRSEMSSKRKSKFSKALRKLMKK